MSSSSNEVTATGITTNHANDPAPMEVAIAPRRRSRRLSVVKRVVMKEVDELSIEDDEVEEEQEDDTSNDESLEVPSTKHTAKKARKHHTEEDETTIEQPMEILYKKQTDYKIDFDLLCGGIIQIIYGFLSTSRDLFKLSQCSKRLRSLVSYEHVIRSAVFGPRYQSVENIVARVEARFIFVPSVQRFLRLVNGIRCERGNCCWRYNLNTKRTPVNHHILRHNGMSLCNTCSESIFHSFNKGGLSSNRALFNQAWFNDFHAYRVPVEPLVEGGTEEHVGPYVGMKTYQQLHSTYHLPRHTMSEEGKEQSKLDLAEGLKQAFERQRSSDPNFSSGEMIVDHFAEAKRDLAIHKENQAHDLAILQANQASQYHKQRKIRNTQKFQNVKNIHKCLVEAVGEMDGKDTILACTWNDPDTSYYSKYCTPVEYSCSLTKALMERLISAPASATKRTIRNATQQICQVFESFQENDFFSFSFLDREDRWERVLHDVCIEKVTPAKFWSYSIASPAFLELVSEGNFRDVISKYVQRFKRTILSEVFTRVVHDTDPPASHEPFTAEEFRMLAIIHYTDFGQSQMTLAELVQDFERTSLTYLTMREGLSFPGGE